MVYLRETSPRYILEGRFSGRPQNLSLERKTMKIHTKAISSAQKRKRICAGQAAFIRCEMLGARKSQLSFQEAELDEKGKMTQVNIKRCRQDEERRAGWSGRADASGQGGHNLLLFASLLCTACIFAVHSYAARFMLPISCCKAGGWSTESSGVSPELTAGGTHGVQT